MTRQYREIPFHGGSTHVRREVYEQNPRASAEELVSRSEALERMERLAARRAPDGGYIYLVDETTESSVTLRRTQRRDNSATVAGAIAALAIFLGGIVLAASAAGWF